MYKLLYDYPFLRYQYLIRNLLMSFKKFLYQIATFFSWMIIAFPALASLNYDPTFIQIVLFFIILLFIKYKKINVYFYIISCLYMLVILLPPYISFISPYLDGLSFIEILSNLIDNLSFKKFVWTFAWFSVYIPLYAVGTFFLVNKKYVD